MTVRVGGKGRRGSLAAQMREVAPEFGPARAFVNLPVDWPGFLGIARRMTSVSRGSPVDGVEVRDVDGPGRGVRLYLPSTADGPASTLAGGAIFWIHGGGMVVGAPEMDDARCAALARDAGVIVVSPRYRLAPEHRAPAALDDVHAAWSWLVGPASASDLEDALGDAPRSVVLAGSSAGGGLAACLAQRLRDEGGPAPVGQMLLYPMLDDRTAHRRDLDAGRHLIWSNAKNRFGWRAYLGGTRERAGASAPPYAVAARCGDLAGLPPTWLGVGTLDLFLDEDLAYAERLRDAGVDVETTVVPGAPHGFDVFAPDAPSSRAFTAGQVAFVRRHLQHTGRVTGGEQATRA